MSREDALRDMIESVGNRALPTIGFEEREPGSFRNLTWLYIPYMLARGGSTARHEERD